MARVTKKELAKQEKYYALMAYNAKIFSTRMMQRLGLETYPDDRLLCRSEDLENGVLAYFTYDGFKYVTFDNAQYYPDNREIKVFDPYNDIRLCTNCVLWYLQNECNVDTDTITSLFVTNSKMNDKGSATIRFYNNGVYNIEGNSYNRDCLKYLDLIYKIDSAIPQEYNDLAQLDMVNFDKFE